MTSLVFTLGSHPQLSLLELEHLLKIHQVTSPLNPISEFQIETNVDSQLAIGILKQSGGLVKISRRLEQASDLDGLLELIGSQIPSHLALSSFSLGQTRLKSLAMKFKTKTKLHFRILKNPLESSGIIKKWTEWQIEQTSNSLEIFQTIAVQDIDNWSRRDLNRPALDARSGMLPPKIARLMINLSRTQSLVTPDQTVYDPFCGSGTILLEALELGFQAIGSDVSTQAITNSEKNLEQYHTSKQAPNSQVFQHDMQSKKMPIILPHPLSIVFEGYLGPAKFSQDRIPNLIRGLDKLYIGVFKRLGALQKSGERMVAALPAFQLGDHEKLLEAAIDSCEKAGYTPLVTNAIYGRPQAQVKRAINVFIKQ